MNHLIVSREYPPCAYGQGGIGTYVANIARLMAERGETVHVIAERWSGAPRPVEMSFDSRLVVHRVPLDEPLPGTAEADRPSAQRILDAMLRSECPVQAFSWQAGLLAESLVDDASIDCIEAQEFEAPLYYFLLRRAAGLGPVRTPPCLIHVHSPTQFVCHHNDWELGRSDQLTLKRLEDYVIQAADAALCPSRFLGRQVEYHYGLNPGSVAWIPLPIGDTERLGRSAETWETGTICYFGRIESRKGVFEWIEALVAVVRERPGLRFELIGSDAGLASSGRATVRDALEARIPADVRPAVSLLPALPRAAIMDRLAAARIVVVPSRWENFPNTCVEAMSTGVAVLSSPEGGMVEMLEDGVSGWIADDASAESLGRALRRALDTPAATKAAMGAAAAEAIRSICGNENVVLRHLELRARVVAQGAVRSGQVPLANSSVTVLKPGETPPSRPASRSAVASRRQVKSPSGHGMAAIVSCHDGTGIDSCIASLLGQTQPFSFVAFCADEAWSAVRERAERACQAGGLTVMPMGRAAVSGHAHAVRQVLAQAQQPLAIAFVAADFRLAPGFVKKVDMLLTRNESVGLVSSWAELGDGETLVINPSPQRPYQWSLDDITGTCVLRTDALRSVDQVLDPPIRGLSASTLALAVLLDGWYGVTLPEVLISEADRRDTLHDAIAFLAMTRSLPRLRRRFPDAVLADAVEVLCFVHVRLETLARRVGELDEAKKWLDTQRLAWEATANERARIISEQSAWIQQLEKARNWLEAERRRWEEVAATRGTELEALRSATLGDSRPRVDET
jgi:glycosyltransferase involved in cell wall biosynthesis